MRELAKKKVIVFDGAMGTAIEALNLPEALLKETGGLNELLNLIHPKAIETIHRNYREAGADVAVTNTFSANRVVLKEYGLEGKVAEINRTAVKIAKSVSKYAALSVGPGSKLPTLAQISYDELYSSYLEQTEAGLSAGADAVIIETCQDLLQMKAAIAAAFESLKLLGKDLPIMASFTVESNGALLVGSDIKTVALLLSHYPIFSLGLNCAMGPDKLRAPLALLASCWGGRLYLSPNAGLPIIEGGRARYPASPLEFAETSAKLVREFDLTAAGGCCGTMHTHIRALVDLISVYPPSKRGSHRPQGGVVSSAYSAIPLRQTPPPALVGERANATGSKLFAKLLGAKDLEGMLAAAKAQEAASHLIDISLSMSGGDERGDMGALIPLLNQNLTAPLMIDSVSPEVIEIALKGCTGKPVINSVNFEDGGAKLVRVLSLLERFPASVVALVIDERGMARNVEHKLEVAERILKVWKEKGFPLEDLIIDFLTFPVTTGDEESRFAALNTLEAIKRFREAHPEVNTLLGVSNVSYGIGAPARRVLNSVFLKLAVEAGLTCAIVHAEKLTPLNLIGGQELELANSLLKGEVGALDKYLAFFEGVSLKDSAEEEDISKDPGGTLARKVLKADTSGVEKLVRKLLLTTGADEILQNILLPAMEQVGVLFGEGKLLLPFVLRAAEVMRKCSLELAPFFKSKNALSKGRIVLATVAGDVHDIGKNLVDIIFSGNGYEVINLGTKVAGEEIVQRAKELKADAIGMSGLLVKSVEIMRENVRLIVEEHLDVKVLLGGAALTKAYVDKDISPIFPNKVYYCKDAFAGLDAMSGERRRGVKAEESAKEERLPNFKIEPSDSFTVPHKDKVTLFEITKQDILPCIAKKTLFARWGAEYASGERELAEALAKDETSKLVGAYIYVASDALVTPYLPEVNGVSLSPFYKKAGVIPLQSGSAGDVREFMERLSSGGNFAEYYKYHWYFAALAEAAAEYVFRRIRAELEVKSIHRYSFGYPLCPDLTGNIGICELLKGSGVLSDSAGRLEPEYSTVAFLL